DGHQFRPRQAALPNVIPYEAPDGPSAQQGHAHKRRPPFRIDAFPRNTRNNAKAFGAISEAPARRCRGTGEGEGPAMSEVDSCPTAPGHRCGKREGREFLVEYSDLTNFSVCD